jgi:hypothetical protein
MESESQGEIKRWVGLSRTTRREEKNQATKTMGPTLNKGNGEIELKKKKNKTPGETCTAGARRKKGKKKKKNE